MDRNFTKWSRWKRWQTFVKNRNGYNGLFSKALGDIVFVEMPKIDTMYKSEGKIIKFDFY